MRQQKFMCLVISLNENYMEKFLDCLSQTAVEYVPHDELFKKICTDTYVHISIVTYISVVVAIKTASLLCMFRVMVRIRSCKLNY